MDAERLQTRPTKTSHPYTPRETRTVSTQVYRVPGVNSDVSTDLTATDLVGWSDEEILLLSALTPPAIITAWFRSIKEGTTGLSDGIVPAERPKTGVLTHTSLTFKINKITWISLQCATAHIFGKKWSNIL